MLFDSHAHYDDEQFDEDRDTIINSAYESGITQMLNIPSGIASLDKCIAIAGKYEFMHAAAGVHPHNVKEMNKAVLDYIAKLSTGKKVVAIGEIGLDYYYDNSPRELQKYWFKLQIDLALKLKLPIIIHNRDSHEDMMKIIRSENAKAAGGVFHCYSGSVEMALELLKNNFYISVGGPVTFNNSRKLPDVIKAIPDDMLLIETDCPYLSPEPYRGKRNDSSRVRLVAQKVAEIKGIDFEEAAALTMKNAKMLFGIK